MKKLIKSSTEATSTLNSLFEELVPSSGKADTVAGEIVRAVHRIAYRYYNDGDHIGVDYGNETCNAPARYLMEVCPSIISNLISQMWGEYSDSTYGNYIEKLIKLTEIYINGHPELREDGNTIDMWSFTEPEDTDYYDEDEYYEDDEYEEW